MTGNIHKLQQCGEQPHYFCASLSWLRIRKESEVFGWS